NDPSSGEIVGVILGSIAGGIAAQIATQQAKNFLTFDPTKLSDLSFLRSLWEVLMRPVEGTLSIKSNRNVTMTAGKGKAMIPTSLMSNYASKGWKNHMNKDEKAAKDLGSTIEGVLIEATRVINTFYEEIQFSEETIRKLSNEFHTHLSFFNSEENKLNDTSQSTIQTLKTKSSEELLNYITDNLCPQLQPADGKENNIEITESLRKFKNNFDTLKRHLDYINEHTKDELLKKINQQLEREKKLQGSNNWPLFVATFNSKEGREQILGSSILSDKKGMKRTVFVAILDIYNDQITHPIIGDVANDEQWNDLINGIEFKNDPKDKEGGVLNSFATALGAELLPVITSGAVTVEDDNVKVFDSGQKLFNRNGCAGPRVLWDVASNGNILVSNSAQHTYQLNLASNGWEPVLNAGLNGLKDYLKKS
ncbi:MAG: hypothetical protein Q4E55_03500, partial [Bacteroidales bacterium]|nr:hypothetical protein [Bacteroidales bacterium]